MTLSALSDDQLAEVISAARDEQASRAISAADPEALIAHGFDALFGPRLKALDPVIVSGVLVCPGSLVPKSASSSDSTFTHVDGYWCWEHPDLIADDFRRVPQGKHDAGTSVTLLPAIDGMQLDVVASTKTRQGNKASRVTSYEVRDRKLVLVSTRTPPKAAPTR